MQMDALAKLEDTDNSTYNIQILSKSLWLNTIKAFIYLSQGVTAIFS